MHTLPSYQRAKQESIHRSPWALLIVLAIVAAVTLLGPGDLGAPAETPGQAPASAGQVPA